MEPNAPQEQAPQEGGQPQMLPIREDVSPPARSIIAAGRLVMLSEKGEAAILKTIEAAGQLPSACATIVMTTIEKAMDKVEEVPPEVPYGDDSVAEYLMDTLFAILRENGVPGADDQTQYEAALDLVDEMAEQAMGSVVPDDGGEIQGPPAAPQGAAPAPQGVPPVMAG